MQIRPVTAPEQRYNRRLPFESDGEEPMIRAIKVHSGAPALAVADVVVLDFDGRHRRRLAMAAEGGLRFLLDLPEAVALADGDLLELEDGRFVRVSAAPEPLVEIAAPSLPALIRIAWHLGNRHLPTELRGDRLRIRRDHVIEAMGEGLGGMIRALDAPFNPEGGAYGHGQVHGHAHGHGDDPDHEHGHAHEHSHSHSHEHEHGHGHVSRQEQPDRPATPARDTASQNQQQQQQQVQLQQARAR